MTDIELVVSGSAVSLRTHAQLREILNNVRIGKEEVQTDRGPRQVSRPAHLVEQEIEDLVLFHMEC